MMFCPDNTTNEGHLPGINRDVCLDRVGYTVRALALSDGNAPTNGALCRPGSRGDFIRALEVLGKRLSKQDYHFKLHERAIEDEQVALLCCPYETWVEVFGMPRNIEEPSASPPFPVQVWRYDCSDGPIECVGHQVNDLEGRRWVTFVRLCYF